MALKPGDTLLNGQYHILRQLGRGGFGFVYLAQDMLLGEQVAIKELIPGLVGDESMLKRFLTEAKATMRLTHERIVRTYNVFSERGNYYIAMEYMAGGSLGERLKEQGPLPVDKAVRTIVQVCEGLHYAHKRGVVHCDLKPANILFTARGEAKVADFGIAHISDQLLDRTWHTMAGFVAGTLPYMSPEQADGVRDDPRIDVYALGAVLYRLLTGRPYLQFDTRDTPAAQAENVLRIRSQRTIPPSKYNPHVPPWLDQVVLKALTKDPDERFASMAQLRAALLRKGQAAAPTAPVRPRRRPAPGRPKPEPTPPSSRPATTPPRPQPAPTAKRRGIPTWFWLLVGGAVLLCLVSAIAIAVGLGGGQDGQETPIVVVVTPEVTPTVAPTIVLVTPTSPLPTPLPPTPTLSPYLYKDDFSDANSGWDVYDDVDAWSGYVDGEYRIAVYQPELAVWISPDPPREFTDFEVEVETRLVEGPLNNNLGLVVRYQPDARTFYWFQIGSDGYYTVVKLQNDEFTKLMDWAESEAINQGVGATNHLRVVCNGVQFSFYVNGTHLIDIMDDAFPTGQIGLAVGAFDEGGVVVHFDNLKVRALQD